MGLINAVPGQVGFSTQMDGEPTYRDLTAFLTMFTDGCSSTSLWVGWIVGWKFRLLARKQACLL
jgi:hypothetical protein